MLTCSQPLVGAMLQRSERWSKRNETQSIFGNGQHRMLPLLRLVFLAKSFGMS